MIKNTFFITLILFGVQLQLFGQRNYHLIESLHHTLFEKNIDNTIYKYSFWSRDVQDSIHINSRYKWQKGYFKSHNVSSICDSIRWSRDVTLIPHLSNILIKQDSIFRNEWGPAFNWQDGSMGLWDDQYESLYALDITLTYLNSINEKWSCDKKYNYLKDLFMLSCGDFDTLRTKRLEFFSDYIRLKMKGYGVCLSIRKAEWSILDDYLFSDPEMVDLVIKDLEYFKQDELPFGFDLLFSSGLEYFFTRVEDDRIDSLIINHSDLFIKLGYTNKIKHWDTKYPIRFYHFVLTRYTFGSKNPVFINMLLDDLYSNLNTAFSSKMLNTTINLYADPLITYLRNERIVDLVHSLKTDIEIGQVKEIISSIATNDRKYLFAMMEKKYGKEFTVKFALE